MNHTTEAARDAGSGPATVTRLPPGVAGPAVRADDAPPRPARPSLLPVLALGGLALLIRLLHLDHPPFIDELNHVFAAESLLRDGTYAVAGEASYPRAWIYTRMVSISFLLFGESLTAARLPAVLAGTALVMFMFVWVRALAGNLAAWCAGLLLCFDPFALFLSQIARFYTMQALAFWIGAACLYHLFDPDISSRRRLALAAGGVLGLNLAKHFSSISLIGWIAVAVGFVLANHRLVRTWIAASRVHAWIAAGVSGVVLLTGIWWLVTGVGHDIWYLFTYADMWAESRRDYVRYYHEYLQGQYGTVWSILPLVMLAAFLVRPRPTLYWGGIFGTALVIHSLAAWKVDRYLFYALPGFFAVTGVAAAASFTWLRQRLMDAGRPQSGRSIPGWVWSAALILLVLATVRFGWGVNGAFAHTADILRAGSVGKPYPYAASDWDGARPYLQASIDSGAIIVATANLKSIYFLGQLDYDLAAEHLRNVDGQRPEFAILGKTGRPVISRPESLQTVVQCHPHGIVIIEEHHWGREWAVPAATAEYIATRMEPVLLPAELQIMAFRWRSEPPYGPGSCPGTVIGPEAGAGSG